MTDFAYPAVLPLAPLFNSFFIAGFEASSHTLHSGKRLNLLKSTQHLQFARQDFARLREVGLQTIRTGVNWHEIEVYPYVYDFSALRAYVRAIRQYDIQPIWDLCHYGYPDDVNVFSASFVKRFVAFARATVQVLAEELHHPLLICPINEISFWAWAGGDGGHLNPFASNRSFEMKRQLVRASLQAMHAMRTVIPDITIMAIDPVISIISGSSDPDAMAEALGHHRAQFQTWDMLCGQLCPELGGTPDTLDVIGVNYYNNNQWIYGGAVLRPGDIGYRPFAALARDVYERYQRPMFIAETGIEGDDRPFWLRQMVHETVALLAEDVPIHGLCLYPILDYPGWEDDRHCASGLWGHANAYGERAIYPPLAEELRRQQQRLAAHFQLSFTLSSL